MKLSYGDGNLQTQQATTQDGTRCICITKHDQGRTVGYCPTQYEKVVSEADVDVILEFKTLASARTLQDELGEMIAKWSREEGEKLPEKPTA